MNFLENRNRFATLTTDPKPPSIWEKLSRHWGKLSDWARRVALGVVVISIGFALYAYGIPQTQTSGIRDAASILVLVGILLIIGSQSSRKPARSFSELVEKLALGVVVLSVGLMVIVVGVPQVSSPTAQMAGIVVAVVGVTLAITRMKMRDPRPDLPIPRMAGTVPDGGTVAAPATALDEWKAAREVLEKFDDRQHDVRKYGVTFVAGLLTAQALLGGTSPPVPHRAKFAVMMATLVLIVALRLTEKDYQLFLRAASDRAITLEKRVLDFGLTRAISRQYEMNKMWSYVDAVYGFLAIASGILGYFILSPDLTPNKAANADILATILAFGIILYVGHVEFE